jgi:predicted Rossmann fold nucleotide-binding protein DprA/Smf involved in DNA uptake
MSASREDAKARTQVLKRLREQHKETVQLTQARLKEQKAARQQICQSMRDTPKTVPEVAEMTGIPAGQVLWHIIAMKKYGLVVETGQCGEYYTYQSVEESKR